MKLIIAEKPSLARNIAAGIGEKSVRCDGYLESQNYIISWAFGHLFSLCDIEHYQNRPKDSRWTVEGLPCCPDRFDYELRKGKNGEDDPGIGKQFDTICRLCADPRVDTLVNAGDADREGEIIVRLCIDHARLRFPDIGNKPLMRLWLPDQTPQTVAKALSELTPEAEYDRLADEGFARTYIDWLYGINLTRYATLKTGQLLRVGRVIVPIVKAIYDRDMEIRNFVPGKYLLPTSREKTAGEKVELVSKKRFEIDDREKAQALCDEYNAAGATVTDVKKKKDTLSPGKLYSLTKLQNYLGRKYKMPMEASLKYAQSLYEKGYLTYPRTNSEYLATAEKDKIAQIIAGCRKIGYPVKLKTGKSIFDDSKIESHSALTPTYKIPKKQDLSEDEYKVYAAVMRRFVAVFCENDCVIERTQITVRVHAKESEDFILKGTVILEPGWTAFDDPTVKDRLLPKLSKGDAVNIKFFPDEKETTPPKHYTIETLNNYLKNPFKEEKAAAKEAAASENGEQVNDEEDYRAVFEGLELGTEATRTGIIDNAKKSSYIELKKDVYRILPAGEFLIESLGRMNISMDKYKTSELGKALKQVYHGKIQVKDSVDMAVAEIRKVFEGDGDSTGFIGDSVGNCPKCGKPVRRRGRFYGCSGYSETHCDFSVNTYICGKAISLDAMRRLLSDGSTGVIDGFRSKNGKSFSAALVLRDGKAVFDFPERKAPTPPKAPEAPYGLCPKCGRPIIKGRTAFGCSGWRDGCDYRKPFIAADSGENSLS